MKIKKRENGRYLIDCCRDEVRSLFDKSVVLPLEKAEVEYEN